ncbi:MAG: DNA primase [Eubacteriales bacterium]|nr:DNA primase [Eubacteriales bacterium]MDD7393717.1 DNA primase [Eubacteriales bacterium]
MAYSFTDEFLTQLRNRCDIEDIIGRYVNLKKTGSSTVGLCPFHSERTPSFHVSGRKQMFYCFGCHKGGDVITFIMEAEHLPYVDAVVFLANMVGLPVPQKNVFDTEIAELRKRILEINRAAARFYFDTLFKPEGKAGLEYFKNRKLTPTTVRRFGLGYAPDSWDSLLKHLLDKGYALDDIKAAGLAIQSKTGGKHFDRFRSRCMFPIIDHRGNVIGFGGRTMDANNPAKYLNSSENLVFKKGQNLFALNIAKNTKETCLILCEGYMDVISLHQAGFDNAVASLGTALTPDQARLIRRYTENVVVCYDSDAAGKKATQRALEILPPAGLNVRVMTVTGGKDPDDMMKEEGGKEKFRRLLDASFNSVDYRFSETLAKYDISVDTEKIECLKKMAEIIAPIPSPAERDVYASKIAEIMTVDKKAVVAEINQRRKRMQRFREKEERAKQLSSLTDANDKVNPQRPRHLKAAKAEEDLLSVLINMPEKAPRITSQISEEDFVTDFNRRVFIALKEKIEQDPTADHLLNIAQYFTPEEMSHINTFMAGIEAINVTDAAIDSAVGILKKEKKKILQRSFDSDETFAMRLRELQGGNRNDGTENK